MEKLRNILVTDRTQADVTAKNGKGTYNDVDLNRVLRACSWLAGRLERYGYSVSADFFPAVLIHAVAEPPDGGAVHGSLCYKGETATVKAVPDEGFDFKGWTESGKTVSESAEYSFTADRDRDLVAVFEGAYIAGFIPDGETECMIAADGNQFYVLR